MSMSERKSNIFGSPPSNFHSRSPSTYEFKNTPAKHQEGRASKENNNRYQLFNETEYIHSPQPPKNIVTEKTQEDEDLLYANVDEHLTPKIMSSLPATDPKVHITCPFCHTGIGVIVEKQIEELKSLAQNTAFALKLGNSQLSEKVKTYSFPSKQNFMSGTLNNSCINESLTDFRSSPFSSRILAPRRSTAKISQSEDLSNLLYELAEHKGRLAAALHKNDENLYELQKKQTELNQLQNELVEKEKISEKLENENFIIKQENMRCKETIYELNASQKIMMANFNKFTKLQIALKT